MKSFVINTNHFEFLCNDIIVFKLPDYRWTYEKKNVYRLKKSQCIQIVYLLLCNRFSAGHCRHSGIYVSLFVFVFFWTTQERVILLEKTKKWCGGLDNNYVISKTRRYPTNIHFWFSDNNFHEKNNTNSYTY